MTQTQVDVIGEGIVYAALIAFNLAVLWILLLPVRIASRVAWRLLMAAWAVGAWLARYA